MPRGEGELFKDKVEVSLDGRQIFYLFFGGAVIACMVFVLGVMVGRRVEARAHLESGAETQASLDPLAALDKLEAGDRADPLVFPRALGGEGDEPAALGSLDRSLVGEPQVKREVGQGGHEAGADSGHQGTAEPEAEAEAKAEPETETDSEADSSETEPESEADSESSETDPEADAEAAVEAEPSSPKFTLQLSSFQDKSDAAAFADELRRAGYDPYVVKADVPDRGVWYRVRIGHYPDYKAALQAKEDFERKKHIIAYVTPLRH